MVHRGDPEIWSTITAAREGATMTDNPQSDAQQPASPLDDSENLRHPQRLTREDVLDICYLFFLAGLDTVPGGLELEYTQGMRQIDNLELVW